tara:strand:- start:1251 stop:2078 length:828 start_codon:yes stop_codon:yes gene_type:complete
MNKFEAYKMDGLGNDFIIFDNRKKSFSLTKDQIIRISDRKNIGCDQVIFIEKDNSNDAFLKFYNSDGGETTACGNGSRCVAYLLMEENNKKNISLKTKNGILYSNLSGQHTVRINMGMPNFKWNKIPLSREMDYKNLNIKISSKNGKEIAGGFSLSVGNPHVVFFVENVDNFNLNEIGPKIENHNYFPQKCNVTIANVENTKHIKVKVWERGAGLTKACGTAACATGVASAKLKLTDRETNIEFQEGSLNINWHKDNNIYMTGKVSKIKKITVNI